MIGDIAELLVRRKYERDGVPLPDKFWNLPKYKPEFAMQARLAAKYIRIYGEEIVLKVLNEEAWCFSLNVKSLVNKFELALAEKEAQETLSSLRPVTTRDTSPKQFKVKKKKDFKDG